MKEYRIEIGVYLYTVQAENLRDAKRLAAYKHRMEGRGRDISISGLIRIAVKA